ncbi:hypothetical protein Btru_007981 [Bulinus truncatus]|nr:hypothetical protein Btru_007981 [Bulinus truncatus]
MPTTNKKRNQAGDSSTIAGATRGEAPRGISETGFVWHLNHNHVDRDTKHSTNDSAKGTHPQARDEQSSSNVMCNNSYTHPHSKGYGTSFSRCVLLLRGPTPPSTHGNGPGIPIIALQHRQEKPLDDWPEKSDEKKNDHYVQNICIGQHLTGCVTKNVHK